MHDIAMTVVAMGSKGVKMTLIFVVVLVILVGAGLFYSMLTRRRTAAKAGENTDSQRDAGGAGPRA